VEAEPLQVDLQSATAVGLVSGIEVRELAINTRNYSQLVALQPGVSSGLASDQPYVGVSGLNGGVNSVSFSINGARESQNNMGTSPCVIQHGSASQTESRQVGIPTPPSFRTCRLNAKGVSGENYTSKCTETVAISDNGLSDHDYIRLARYPPKVTCLLHVRVVFGPGPKRRDTLACPGLRRRVAYGFASCATAGIPPP
jgi:hypothetical protein